MSQNRPMTEFEGALFDAVLLLGTIVPELGADSQSFQNRLLAARDAAEGLGNQHSVQTLNFLIASLFAQPAPAPKPTFRVV